MKNSLAQTEGGFGVYLHWPFCAAKCPYCDFNSHVRHTKIDQQAYVDAFRKELAHIRSRTGPRSVGSIFLGGGTPSLMDPQTVGALLDCVAGLWTIEDNAEITLEANPSSVEASRFIGYRGAGVNRVSLGVQAMNDADLKMLGRLHDKEQALGAIRLARETFPRLSFDLIYARRPSQTEEEWAKELEEAISHAADHLSLYQLTIEEGTPFHGLYKAGKLKIPDEDHAARLYQITQDITAANGLPAYEVSNHAVPGAESRHNLVYWRYGEYVGAGPGAHGRFREGYARTVTMTEKNPENWLDAVGSFGHGVVEEEHLMPDQEGDEMLLMGLRLSEGISLERFERLTGKPLSQEAIVPLISDGMLEITPTQHLRATRNGMMVLDAVVADLAR
ncbi:MAG: radical SAM family heme chaperone HemW [Notoacmeibacter sp.]